MASSKTVAKGIRITNEAEEYYRDKPLNRIVEGLIPLLKSGELIYDGEEVKILRDDSVRSEAMGDINEMLGFTEMTFDDLLRDISEKMENGELILDDRRTRVGLPRWAEEFEEACHDLCIPVEKAAEKAIRELRK